MSVYEHGTDQELIALFHTGDEFAAEALLRRYAGYVRYFARRYSLVGGDAEDLIQEGMIGLFQAIRSYDAEKSASFRTYSASCILNRLTSAIRNDAQGKNQPLNHSIPLEAPLFDCAEQNLVSPSGDPVEYVIGDEGFQELMQVLGGLLSKFEARVLELYLEGRTYEEISEVTAKPRKSIDNAIQRIRKKLSGHISQSGIRGEISPSCK